MRPLIITKESLGLRSCSIAAAAALNLWGILSYLLLHSVKRREDQEDKKEPYQGCACDPTALMFPILTHPSSSVVFCDLRGLIYTFLVKYV